MTRSRPPARREPAVALTCASFGLSLAISRSFYVAEAAFLAPGHQFILGKVCQLTIGQRSNVTDVGIGLIRISTTCDQLEARTAAAPEDLRHARGRLRLRMDHQCRSSVSNPTNASFK
jgi:hypothetical protein